jgi:hypothetical protein
MTIEHAALAIGAFLVVMILIMVTLIWRKLRFIDARLSKIPWTQSASGSFSIMVNSAPRSPSPIPNGADAQADPRCDARLRSRPADFPAWIITIIGFKRMVSMRLQPPFRSELYARVGVRRRQIRNRCAFCRWPRCAPFPKAPLEVVSASLGARGACLRREVIRTFRAARTKTTETEAIRGLGIPTTSTKC